MNLREYQDTKYPFEEYLKEIHATVYIGSNDDMTEDLKNFLTNLDGEEYIKHGNAFAKILLSLIPKDVTKF